MKRAALVFALAWLTGCGFQLRGVYRFPFNTVSVEAPREDGRGFGDQLKSTMQSDSTLRIVEIKDKPQARVRVLEVFSDKRILSLSSGGKVREFLLEQRVKFDVVDTDDRMLLPETVINATRDFSFADAQALAKEGEERLLRADMQNDLIAQMIRQLQTVKPVAK